MRTWDYSLEITFRLALAFGPQAPGGRQLHNRRTPRYLGLPLNRITPLFAWYIIGSIPSFLDKDTANGTEEYVWDEEKQRIAVTFTSNCFSHASDPVLSEGGLVHVEA